MPAGFLLGPDFVRGLMVGVVVVFLPFDFLRLRGHSPTLRLLGFVPVFRNREARRISGASVLFLAMGLTSWLPWPAAAAGLLAGSLADPAASLAGSLFVRHRPAKKTIPGSLAALAVGFLSALLVGFAPMSSFAVGIAASAAERWGLFDDNLWIAPAAAVTALLTS